MGFAAARCASSDLGLWFPGILGYCVMASDGDWFPSHAWDFPVGPGGSLYCPACCSYNEWDCRCNVRAVEPECAEDNPRAACFGHQELARTPLEGPVVDEILNTRYMCLPPGISWGAEQ